MKKLIVVLLMLFQAACSIPKKLEAPPATETNKHSMESYSNLGTLTKKKPPTVSSIRIQSLRDTALSVGARGGLSEHSKKINAELDRHSNLLTRIFNFEQLMLENNVLPPVLVEARNNLSLNNSQAIRISDVTYKIADQARFVTRPPTWRDYLYSHYSMPENPDSTLLPKDEAERIIWQKYIAEGWKAGISQSKLIFSQNLAHLKRDMEGMIRYISLLKQNMVSKPYVAKAEMGITGSGREINVNDRVLRITSLPELQPNGETWQTEITPKHKQ